MIITSAICPIVYYLYSEKVIASAIPPQIKKILEDFKHKKIPSDIIGENKLSSESKNYLPFQ